MPPPIHWKWGLRGCALGQSLVKVNLPTDLLSVTVGADLDQSMEKVSLPTKTAKCPQPLGTVDDRWTKSTVI